MLCWCGFLLLSGPPFPPFGLSPKTFRTIHKAPLCAVFLILSPTSTTEDPHTYLLSSPLFTVTTNKLNCFAHYGAHLLLAQLQWLSITKCVNVRAHGFKSHELKLARLVSRLRFFWGPEGESISLPQHRRLIYIHWQGSHCISVCLFLSSPSVSVSFPTFLPSPSLSDYEDKIILCSQHFVWSCFSSEVLGWKACIWDSITVFFSFNFLILLYGVFISAKTGAYYSAHGGMKLMVIPLPQPSQCWDYSCVPPLPAPLSVLKISSRVVGSLSYCHLSGYLTSNE